MEHGLKKNCVLCSKTYNALHSCHNFPVGSRQASRGARICEKSLLEQHDFRIKLSMKADAPESSRGIFLLGVGPTFIKKSLKCSQLSIAVVESLSFILKKCHSFCSFAVYLLSVLKFATFFVNYPYAFEIIL